VSTLFDRFTPSGRTGILTIVDQPADKFVPVAVDDPPVPVQHQHCLGAFVNDECNRRVMQMDTSVLKPCTIWRCYIGHIHTQPRRNPQHISRLMDSPLLLARSWTVHRHRAVLDPEPRSDIT